MQFEEPLCSMVVCYLGLNDVIEDRTSCKRIGGVYTGFKTMSRRSLPPVIPSGREALCMSFYDVLATLVGVIAGQSGPIGHSRHLNQ